MLGTKNAYTNGTYVYKNKDGKYIKKEWRTELGSDGSGVAAFTIPEGASNVKFKILWAGIWNEAGTATIAKECSMTSYSCK